MNLQTSLTKTFGFGFDDRRRFYGKVAKLLSNGVPIRRALQTISTLRLKLKGPKDYGYLVLDDLIASIENGSSFGKALEKWAPASECMLISAGERGGDLIEGLGTAVALMESKNEIRGTIIGSLIYPVVLLCLAFGIAYLFGQQVFPKFFAIAPEDKWTGFARYGIYFSHFVEDYLITAVASVAALITVIFTSLPIYDGRLRVKLDKYPPYSLYRIVNGSVFIIALSALVRSGERIEDALTNLSKNTSSWLRSRIELTLEQIRQGFNLGESLERIKKGFPDDEMVEDLIVYAQLSGVEAALRKMGVEAQDKAISAVRNGSKVIFVVLFLTVACLLAFLIGALLSMQMQITTIIKS